MTIFSKQDEFEWKNAITVTRVSTNSIDLQVAGRDIANADNLWLFGAVSTAFTAAGAATLKAELIDDDNAALASPAVLQDLTGGVVAVAALVAGYTLFKTRLALGKITQRYLGIQWTVATGPMTAGAVVAGFTPNVDAWKAFPRGYVNN